MQTAYIGNKESLIRYFAEGCKGCRCVSLGVEVEHFVVYGEEAAAAKGVAPGTAVSYYGDGGIEELLLKLCDRYPEHKKILTPEGRCLGFSVKGFIITLEPAAQLEISIAPFQSIAKIKEVYEGFRNTVLEVIAPYGYELKSEGYQPASRVNDLKLIPKARYELMDLRFQTSGKRGRNMMRGTASVQVSVDYRDETDFARKYRAAYLLMPVIKLLMDNTKTFEGAPNTIPLRRTEIWDNVDPARCGIVPGLFAEDSGREYTFGDYADYILQMPPIFLPSPDGEIYTADKKVCELFADKEFDRQMTEHLVSMVFPDVRLKQYIEIRGADGNAPEKAYAYAALIKGTIYNEAFLAHAEAFCRQRGITAKDIKFSESSLMANGWNGKIYGYPAREAARTILRYAEDQLPEEEKPFLAPFYDMLAD